MGLNGLSRADAGWSRSVQMKPSSALCPTSKLLQPSSPSLIPTGISRSLEGPSGWLQCPGILVVSNNSKTLL